MFILVCRTIAQVSKCGFKLRRTHQPDYDRLALLSPEDWMPMSLYIVRIESDQTD